MTLVELPYRGLTIHQDPGQPVSSDAAFLVETVGQHIHEKFVRLLELGAGTGIVSIMLKLAHPHLDITALEIRKKAYDLARANLERSGVSLNLLHRDLRDFTDDSRYGLIVSNPPFIPLGKGRLGPDEQRNIARHELLCDMTDIAMCVRRNLAPDGIAFLLYPDDRIPELERQTKKVDLRIVKQISSPKGRKGTTIALVSPHPEVVLTRDMDYA